MGSSRQILVATALAAVAFLACTSPANEEPGFADWVGSWVLTGGIETIDAWPATLEISEGEAWGNLCNGFEVLIGADGFVTGNGTALSCGPEVDALEQVFMRAVDGATPEMVDGQLVLTGPASVLTFARQEASPAPDPTQVGAPSWEPVGVCPVYPSGFQVPFDVAALDEYGAAHAGTWGGWGVEYDEDDVAHVVVWIKDDPGNHDGVVEIAGPTVPVDFRSADHTLTDLQEASDSLGATHLPGLLEVRVDQLNNRVRIEVEADRSEVQAALRDVGRDLYCLVPHTGPVTPWGVQVQSGADWRLLGETLSARPYAVALSSTSEGFEQMWARHFTGPLPNVDFDREIVLYFGGVVSSGCPQILLADVRIDDDEGAVYSVFTRPGVSWCRSDARPHGYAVAVERAALPDRFELRMQKALPLGVADEVIAVDLIGPPQDHDWGIP